MENGRLLNVVETLQKHVNAGFEAAKATIRDDGTAAVAILEAPEGRSPEPAHKKGWDTAALERPLPDGTFHKSRAVEGVRYRWPDGNVDEYTEFVLFEGIGGFSGERYAVARIANGDVIGFVVYDDEGKSKQGITYFQAADDFASTDEVISYVRGGGTTGKAGFGPFDSLPTAYESFKTEALAERVSGKWNRLGVVAHKDDVMTVLAHTALQARLRRLA